MWDNCRASVVSYYFCHSKNHNKTIKASAHGIFLGPSLARNYLKKDRGNYVSSQIIISIQINLFFFRFGCITITRSLETMRSTESYLVNMLFYLTWNPVETVPWWIEFNNYNNIKLMLKKILWRGIQKESLELSGSFCDVHFNKDLQ